MQDETETAADAATRAAIEIAAEIQAELYHAHEQEAEHIVTAQSDVIMQAAARLQHEINNPLFAISGNTESAIKKLKSLEEAGLADITEIVARLERVLMGAERIQNVLKSFSCVIHPTTEDYLPGIPMLKLSPE